MAGGATLQKDPTLLREALANAENPNAPLMELHLFTPDEAIEAAPEFVGLIRLWAERRGDASVPDWCDMDFTDFRGWHSSLILSEFEGEEPDPLYRLIGEEFVDVAQFNATGLRFSQVTPNLYQRQFRDHFRKLRQRGLIGFASGRVALKGRDHIFLRVLELPFRDGGQQVKRTVHVMSLVKV